MATQDQLAKQKTMSDRIAELVAKRSAVELGGGKGRIEHQHAAGKMTARERIAKLIDREKLRRDWAVCPSPRDLIRHGRQGTARRWRGHRMRHS